ncbi:Metalloprotease [Mycena floridula]|nr:Metalloprotease [Mycena floridula]
MRFSIATTLLLSSSALAGPVARGMGFSKPAQSSLAAAAHHGPPAGERVRCSTKITKFRTLAASPATGPIPVHFHVIYANETLAGGYVPDEQLTAQVKVLNADYKSTGLSFKLAETTRTENKEWGLHAELNVYTVGFVSGSGEGLVGPGYATFPADYKENPQDDGVVMLYSTVPGGSSTNYDKGRTLTHEAGLYHTFEGGCKGVGDGVTDTPAEASAAYQCPTGRDTCKGTGKGSKGLDPIKNYMDYSYDSCMDNFTPGQAKRLQGQVRAYRGIHVDEKNRLTEFRKAQ